MLRLFLSIAAVTCMVASASAETIELTSGKLLEGTIVSMDGKLVQFQPKDESQKQTIQRGEIAQITFGERAEMTRKKFSVAKLLREIREEGFDEESWQDLQKRIKVIETPELQRYLDDTIAGLRQDLQQVRRDAEEAQDEITELRQEYAPHVDTLNDYMIALQQILGATGELEDARVSVAVDVDEERNAKPQSQRERTAERQQAGDKNK